MFTLSDSENSSANYKSHKNQNNHNRLKQNSRNLHNHNVKHLSNENKDIQSKVRLEFHNKFKNEPGYIIVLDSEEETITGDINFSISQNQMANSAEAVDNDSKQIIKIEEDPLLIKQEPIQIFLNEVDTKNEWLNSITFFNLDPNGEFSKCPACDTMFFSNDNLKDHLFSHSHKKQDQIICAYCNLSTTDFNEFVSHLHVHATQCQICNYSLTKKKILEKHLKEAKLNFQVKRDRLGYFTCIVCHLSFDLIHQLQKHWFKHSCKETKIYQCNFCSALFDSAKDLENHKCLQCPVCLKIYSSFPSLRCHTRYQKHFLYCSICSYEFSLQIDHERHLELHRKIYKPHDEFVYCLQAQDCETLQCELCGKLLQTSPSFVSHVYHEHNVNVTKEDKYLKKEQRADKSQPLGIVKLTDDIIFEEVKIEVTCEETKVFTEF